MTFKECCAVLGVGENADPAEIKRAYRRLAFFLHPDLNPQIPDASRRFQEVNEAYVTLSKRPAGTGSASARTGDADASSNRAREEARRAYAQAGRRTAEGSKTSGAGPRSGSGAADMRAEDVLRDILNDPFARRVYEDIYSRIEHGGRKKPPAGNGDGKEPAAGGKGAPLTRATPAGGTARARPASSRSTQPGVFDKVKGWFLRQIDEEQVLRLPGRSLVPGARVRLEIQHGFTENPQIIEITLPPEFEPGKAMRLKGMGRRIGNLHGDLYVRIEPT
ncbi:MAG: DnaJ domain-containing protein [Desulfovibrio sp.]|jgi:molecular chaperone DnaJ|nr:DnaJ domain-containing protein [Desulfovibrio sp.]